MLAVLSLCSTAFSAASHGAVHSLAPQPQVRATRVMANVGGVLEAPVTPALCGGGGNGGWTGRGGGDGGGGGGGDGEGSEFLRLLDSVEQASAVDDWAARARIYRMTNNAELQHAHSSALAELESFRAFDTAQAGANGRRMLLGLFSGEQLSSMACAGALARAA